MRNSNPAPLSQQGGVEAADRDGSQETGRGSKDSKAMGVSVAPVEATDASGPSASAEVRM